MIYTNQIVKLPLETPLLRILPPRKSITLKSMIDIGKDFSVFIASTNNVTNTILYVKNSYNNNEAPNPFDPLLNNDTEVISSSITDSDDTDYVTQITINYDEGGGKNSQSCKSITSASTDISDYKCEYWITIYNPNINETFEFVILATSIKVTSRKYYEHFCGYYGWWFWHALMAAIEGSPPQTISQPSRR